MLRVLLLLHTLKGVNGIASHVSKLKEWLERKGHHVELLTARFIRVRGLANPNIALYLVMRVLAERLRGARFDVVHVHHIFHYPAGRVLGKPLVLTLHSDILGQYSLLHPRAKRLIAWLEKTAVHGASIVTTISPYISQLYRERYGRDIIYIPNAIDLNDIPEDSDKEHNVIFVGRLSHEKGIDILLQAAEILEARNARIRILVVGDGPLRRLVEKYASRLDNLVYLGYMTRKEAWRHICRSSILVLPSMTEGFPTVILEAFACKTLVIASDISELRAIFSPREVVFVNRRPETFADAIEYYLINERERTRIVEEAYRTLVSRFTWDKVVNMYIEVYKRASAGRE